ncbi:DUF1801 domain-containing protein [Paenibacillus sinopodophylli]|uniref:DUF1801 domain-containing protein n=1 Tax=Paenibacillus sinopodophylli TaxID=1837342 RepID=UPI00110CECB6|nr:DUF1801 domain-containing protein [Paenibacillus sinopodophylli]
MAENRKKPEKSTKIKQSGKQQVNAFMQALEHPLKSEIEEVRTIILSVNEHITEHLKWNAPSFCYHNEDRITFNLQGKGFFRLIFHCGSKVKEHAENERIISDQTGILEWITNDRAVIKLTDMNDVQSKKERIWEIAAKWLEATNTSFE